MQFLDKIIVSIAHKVVDGVMAVGAGLVYAQFIAMLLLLGGGACLMAVFLARLLFPGFAP